MTTSGRDFDELRPISFELDYISHPEGSVLVCMGETKVLCNATVEETVPRWIKYAKKKHGWVTAEYAMLPRSTTSRSRRETLTPKGRTQEITRLVGRSLRGAVDLQILGERQIILDCDVLQADGGTRTASVNGGYVALALAIYRMQAKGIIEPGALKQSIAAVSVGTVAGKPFLDLDYALDLAADVDLNVVMTGDGRYIEIQGTAEGEPYDRNALDIMLGLAEKGIRQIVLAQTDVLAAHVPPPSAA